MLLLIKRDLNVGIGFQTGRAEKITNGYTKDSLKGQRKMWATTAFANRKWSDCYCLLVVRKRIKKALEEKMRLLCD